MDVNKKRQDEEEMLKLKIQLYCRGNHGRKSELCEDCRQLLEYSWNIHKKVPYCAEKWKSGHIYLCTYSPFDGMKAQGYGMVYVRIKKGISK